MYFPLPENRVLCVKRELTFEASLTLGNKKRLELCRPWLKLISSDLVALERPEKVLIK